MSEFLSTLLKINKKYNRPSSTQVDTHTCVTLIGHAVDERSLLLHTASKRSTSNHWYTTSGLNPCIKKKAKCTQTHTQSKRKESSNTSSPEHRRGRAAVQRDITCSLTVRTCRIRSSSLKSYLRSCVTHESKHRPGRINRGQRLNISGLHLRGQTVCKQTADPGLYVPFDESLSTLQKWIKMQQVTIRSGI